MKKRTGGILAGLAAVFFCVGGICGAEEKEREPAIRVMSFNIRFGAAEDGKNSWEHRRYLVLETIQMFGPDLLGTQEVLGFQAAFLRKSLKGYGFHGVGRDDGKAKSEMVPVFYRLDRFALLDAGHFWLSETPKLAGSRGWDASLPRMVSWVILRDRKGGGRQFVFANAHLDHRGSQARLESAKLIGRWAESVEMPVILAGDFNAGEGSDPYNALARGKGFEGSLFVDSYRAIHSEKSPREGTFSAWIGRREGSRIDWILHSAEFLTLNASINYTNEEGRYPSDHYPVQAILRRR